jgi:3-deoxy-D-manno-octulosonic-acid transferase
VDIWLHAVSLGEVVAATPLIERFLEKQLRVLVTTMTPTGSEQVARCFGTRVFHQYIPYDFPFALRRFFRAIQARAGIIMETELWPNLIMEATKAKVPLFLANARISNRAFKQYERIRFILRPLFNQFTYIMAQSPLDKARYIALGASDDKVIMLGNMKFDLYLSTPHAALAQSFKQSWGASRPVVILASTHEGEESQLLSVLKLLQQSVPQVILLIAPRHPERFQVVYQLCEQRGVKVGLRSQPQSIDMQSEVVVLDSLGELLSFYSVSDYAFVGGSMVAVGGHNVLEPIALKVPVLCGPHMQNSQSIVDELLNARALVRVKDAAAWVEAVAALHNDNARCLNQINQATAILVTNQGAVTRHFDMIQPYVFGADLLTDQEAQISPEKLTSN